MRHGSLFSGIGGFDLAAQWMGWENVFQVEIDPFCQKVLEKNFPTVKRHGDIKQFNGTKYRGAVDILTGGFPCQPFSSAGKRKGTDDNRYLWPEMLRVIREVQPAYVVGEKVGGLVNWSGGLVFDQVQADLENEGFETQAFILPACAINAPHRRDRIWFVAYSSSNYNQRNSGEFQSQDEQQAQERQEGWISQSSSASYRIRQQRTNSNSISNGRKQSEVFKKIYDRGVQEGMEKGHEPDPSNDNGNVTHSNVCRLERRQNTPKGEQSTHRDAWSKFPTQSPVCGGDDGVPSELDIIKTKYREHRIKGLGNAVVPQVVFEIFKAIERLQKLN
jgi:DNA (cytosine-5)-methyltransferase 1